MNLEDLEILLSRSGSKKNLIILFVPLYHESLKRIDRMLMKLGEAVAIFSSLQCCSILV